MSVHRTCPPQLRAEIIAKRREAGMTGDLTRGLDAPGIWHFNTPLKTGKTASSCDDGLRPAVIYGPRIND